jgi:hypothetical protein
MNHQETFAANQVLINAQDVRRKVEALLQQASVLKKKLIKAQNPSPVQVKVIIPKGSDEEAEENTKNGCESSGLSKQVQGVILLLLIVGALSFVGYKIYESSTSTSTKKKNNKKKETESGSE